MFGARAVVSVLVAAAVVVAVLPTVQVAAADGFTDVPADAYYADAVGWLVDQGITQGTTPSTFSPDDTVTRGQMAAFLHRFGYEPAGVTHGFSDVPAGSYFGDAVGWLLLHGVTQGTGPGDALWPGLSDALCRWCGLT